MKFITHLLSFFIFMIISHCKFEWFLNKGIADVKILYCKEFNIISKKKSYKNCNKKKIKQPFYKIQFKNNKIILATLYKKEKIQELHQFKYKKLNEYSLIKINYFENSKYLTYNYFKIKNKNEYISSGKYFEFKINDNKYHKIYYQKKIEHYNSIGELLSSDYYQSKKNSIDKLLTSIYYYNQSIIGYKIRRYKKKVIEEKQYFLNCHWLIFYNYFDNPELIISNNKNTNQISYSLYYYDSYKDKANLLFKEKYFSKNTFFYKLFKKIQIKKRQELIKKYSLQNRKKSVFKSLKKYLKSYKKLLTKKVFSYFESKSNKFFLENDLHKQERLKKIEYYDDNILTKITHFNENNNLILEENFNFIGEKIFE